MVSQDNSPGPACLFFGVMTAHADLFEKTEQTLADMYGPVSMRDAVYDFDLLTRYYTAEFGTGLSKTFLAMRDLVDPGTLAAIKVATNRIEAEFAEGPDRKRKVNIDPGYLMRHKVVLASTRDRAHRVYLDQGIYGEVALVYRDNETGFVPETWTYPDYAMRERLDFFSRLRKNHLQQLRERD